MTKQANIPAEPTYLQTAPAPQTASQSEQFHKDGYVLVSGLIPPSLSSRAERAMWCCIGYDPDDPPASWDNAPSGLRLYNEADLKIVSHLRAWRRRRSLRATRSRPLASRIRTPKPVIRRPISRPKKPGRI